MLTYVTTSLFDSPAQTLVNTVNTVGVMGKGIAAEFKKRYPDMYARYRELCQAQRLDVGLLWLYRTPNKWVMNFPTKKHWKNPSQLKWIEAGLVKFVATYTDRGITSVSFPMLGCGNGGLDWKDVQPLMEHHLQKLPIPVFIHVAGATRMAPPEHRRPDALAADRTLRETIALLQFWNDLRATCNVPPELRLPMGEDEEAAATFPLHLAGGQAVDLALSDIEALFHKLRLNGALKPIDYPSAFHHFGDELTQQLLQLPYIQPIEFAESDTAGRASLGIRFAPRASLRPEEQSWAAEAS